MKKELDGAHRSNWEAEEGVRGACGAHALTGGVQKRLRGRTGSRESFSSAGGCAMDLQCVWMPREAKPTDKRERTDMPTGKRTRERGAGRDKQYVQEAGAAPVREA